MEEKNIKDIIIEDEATSKGSQLKNILILLALLFIILVVSIVITRLILGGDDNTDTASFRADGTSQEISESNLTSTTTAGLASATDSVNSGAGEVVAIGAAALAAGAATVALTSKNADDTKNSATETASSIIKTPLLAERNTTSRTKIPLRTEQPEKSNTKSASTESSTPPKKRATTASSYTQPKYVKKTTTSTTTRTTTKKVIKPKKYTSKRVTRGYYIKVGAFTNPSTAIRNIKAVKLNYRTTKTKDGKLTRVLIGPFYSRRDAQNHLAKAKSNVAADAYIAKIK
ncbi:MAG: SPOR domain-containing protein [Sulfurovaceae bacterium]|nr:SPOR domain-containing protein [Sulfurovaceae bacterium]